MITMSTIRLRLPDSLHQTLRELAAKEKVSINQLISLAVEEKVSALATEDCLGTPAGRASREKFLRAMAKIPDVEPDEGDRLSPLAWPSREMQPSCGDSRRRKWKGQPRSRLIPVVDLNTGDAP